LDLDRVTVDAGSDHHWQPQHVGSQALGEVRHRLVDVFLWQLFPDGHQGGFQLIKRLKLRLEIMVHFQHGATDVIVQRLQIWRVWGSFFSVPGQLACSQFCIMLECREMRVTFMFTLYVNGRKRQIPQLACTISVEVVMIGAF